MNGCREEGTLLLLCSSSARMGHTHILCCLVGWESDPFPCDFGVLDPNVSTGCEVAGIDILIDCCLPSDCLEGHSLPSDAILG